MRKDLQNSGHSTSPQAETGPSARPTGVSRLLSRILEQLSVSSWLPAAMLVGNLAVMLQMRQLGVIDLVAALQQLAAKPLGTLVVLLFALLLATMGTQAFEFEIIRLLEGYRDRASRPALYIAGLQIARHRRKRQVLESRLNRAVQEAYVHARAAMTRRPGSYLPEHIQILDKELLGWPGPPQMTEQQRAAADTINWQEYVPAEALYAQDALLAQLEDYPEEHRMMPTRLGNLLRAGEDRLALEEDENLEFFVIRHYDKLPTSLREEHRDYRTRLDMYCSLVLVFSFLAVMSGLLLAAIAEWWAIAIVMAGFGMMALVSYKAAIASARGYVGVLSEIGRYAQR